MKVLVCHTYYKQRGGEDEVFDDEANLLTDRGHDVVHYTHTNHDIDKMSPLRAAQKAVWNQEVYRELRVLLRRERPDVMHCTNIFPLISPSAYYAAKAEGVPVVQSLHNYRLLCVNALLQREGSACETCLGKTVALAGVRHGCYRDSRSTSAVVATLQTVHRLTGTWRRAVDLYVAMTSFARKKFIEGGLPAEKVAVKPNFIAPDPGRGDGAGGYAIFVGRLSQEKGISTLLEAWERTPGGLPLKIVGDGPMADDVRRAAQDSSAIEWLGYQRRKEVHELVQGAKLLVAPSTCYEGALPRTILEAFAAGTPIVASRMGSIAAEVTPGETGRLFKPRDPDDLAATVDHMASNKSALERMRRAARDEFESKYTKDRNYELLLSVYRRAISQKRSENADFEGN